MQNEYVQKKEAGTSTTADHTSMQSVHLADNRPRSIVQQKLKTINQQKSPSTQLKKTNQAALNHNAPVQRYVFINNNLVEPNTQIDEAASAKEKMFVRDRYVRNYLSTAEWNAHAAGQTDYIGNTKSGKYAHTWVRFDPVRMNVLGERHTLTPLDEITTAVGTTSFAHERFTDGAFNHGPVTQQTDRKENAPRHERFGTSGHHDKTTAHLGEALLPKIAFVLNSLQHVTEQNLLDWTQAKFNNEQTRDDAYNGLAYMTYMKYALATAYDKKPAFEQYGHSSWPDPLPALYGQLYKIMGSNDELAHQIMASPAGSFLGDVVKPDAIDFIKTFSVTYLKLADISREEDKNFKAFKHVDPKTAPNVYMKWRDTYMIRQLHRAYQSHTRYFGLGNTHLTNLLGNIHEMGMNVNAVDMIKYMPIAHNETERLFATGLQRELERKSKGISTDLKDLGKVITSLSKGQNQKKGGI